MNPRHSLTRRAVLRRTDRPARNSQDESSGSFTGSLLRASRPGMGTTFEIRLPESTPGAAYLACQALDRVDDLESQLTVYRDESEISRLNATAHLAPVPVEDGLFKLIERAITLGQETGGAYDLTSGALSLAWGFTRGPKRVPTDRELADALSRTGSRHLRLDPISKTVGFDREGIVLNFGSLGKGYAIDQAVQVIREYPWPTSALVHSGNSSVYALGSPAGTLMGRWRIGLRNPFDPSRPLGEIALRNRGLGTSGSAFQHFESGGKLYGHIIDPRTGFPPQSECLSVSVLAPTAAEADALSTAFYLMGPEATTEYLGSRPEIAAIFILQGSDRKPPRMVLRNLEVHDFLPDPTVRLAISPH